MSEPKTPAEAVLSVDQAVERLSMSAIPVKRREAVELMDALGRVLAQDQVSGVANPPHDNSAMDGYGVRLADLKPSGLTALPVGLRVPAGASPSLVLPPRQAARIFTGAPIPKGVDAVVPQEVCVVPRQGVVEVPQASPGDNIRRLGEDFAVGDTVLKAGTVLRPQEIGMAAAIGRTHLTVWVRPKVAFFSTGDEVYEPGQPLPPGGVYDMNRYTILSLVRLMGCEPIDLGNLPDDPTTITGALQQARLLADVIMTSGGVSVGEEDHVKPAVEALGSLDFWRVSMRPGRPIAFGSVGTTPFFGLPGNPVSSMVCFMIFARPYLARLAGRKSVDLPIRLVPSGFEFKKRPGRREWLRGWIETDGHGTPLAYAYPNQSSGVLSSMVAAEGLIDVPEESSGFAQGEVVRFIPFADLWI